MDDSVEVMGLDIAKTIFVAVGIDRDGREIVRRKLVREQVLDFFSGLKPMRVGIEACAGSHYWARHLLQMGHDVKLIAAQHVKPFVNKGKNDVNDARAIAEIRSRATTKYVPTNTQEQQDLQVIHRLRQGVMRERTSLVNRVRGLIAEYGYVFPIGVNVFMKRLGELINEPNALTEVVQGLFKEQLNELKRKAIQLDQYDRQIAQMSKQHEPSAMLMTIPGVGQLTSTAIVMSLNASDFESGRDFAANLGLVPRQHSSGGKDRLLGITKRGDGYLRMLLIHGARSALRFANRHEDDPMLQWALKLQQRSGAKIAIVALANKLARVAWAVLHRAEAYRHNQQGREFKFKPDEVACLAAVA